MIERYTLHITPPTGQLASLARHLGLKHLHAFTLLAFAAFSTFSIAGAHISLGLLLLCVLWRALSQTADPAKSFGSRLHSLALGIEWPVFIFVLACMISTTISEAPLESFRNSRNLLTILGAYGVAYSLRFEPAWRRPVLWIFLLAATLASVWGLVKFGLGMTVRVQSTQSTSMTWGAMCAMFLLLTLQAAFAGETRHQRWWARLFVLPQFGALLLSIVRGAYVGFAAGVTYLMARYWKRLLPLAAILLLLAGVLAPASVRERVAGIFDLKNPTTLVRFTQWRIGAMILADHPLFGVGLRDLAPLTRRYAQPDPDLPAAVNEDIFHIGHYHNTYVTLAVCLGGVGLLMFFALMVQVWRQLGKVSVRADSASAGATVLACRAAMIGFLFTGLFDWTFGDAEVVTMFWFIIGLGLGQAPATSLQLKSHNADKSQPKRKSFEHG